MSKIRGVKPEFWTDEDIVELSIPARLLFIGMWNFACDNGHLPDKPKQIKMRILPADIVDVNSLLDELVQRGRITRIDGVVTIAKFAHHQKPHSRWWATCDMPGCVKPGTPSTVAASHPTTPNNGGATVATGGHGGQRRTTAVVDGDGDGEGEGELTPTESGPRKRGTRLPDDWMPPMAAREQMAADFPHIDQRAEHAKFCDHWRAQPGQRGVKLDWTATYRNWIRRAAEQQPRSSRPRSQQATDDLFSRAMARAEQRDLEAS